MNLLLQLLINGLVNASLYAMMAVGFGIVYRTTAIFHLAYGSLYVIAAYLFYTFFHYLGLPVVLAAVLAVVSNSFIGLLMEKGLYLPFYKRKAGSGAILIGSLGLFIVLENLVAMVFGNEVKVFSNTIEPSYKLASFVITRIQVLELITGVVVLAIFGFLIKKMHVFKAIWAMGDEPELVPVLGISLYRLRSLVFLISSAFIAIPACLISWDVGADPHMGMSYLMIAMVAVIFGGVDSYYGWIFGGAILAILQSLAVWKLSSNWIDLVTFVVLILVLLIRPEGFLGTPKRLEEQ